jgi:hypothetical protein
LYENLPLWHMGQKCGFLLNEDSLQKIKFTFVKFVNLIYLQLLIFFGHITVEGFHTKGWTKFFIVNFVTFYRQNNIYKAS